MVREEGDSHGRQKEFSLYVENLPSECTVDYVGEIFGRYGRITDIYIPQRRTKSSRLRFGFVRFNHEEEAEDAVNGLRGVYIGSFKLSVSWAKFRKKNYNKHNMQRRSTSGEHANPSKTRMHQINQVVPPKASLNLKLQDEISGGHQILNVVGQKDGTMMDKMSRSIIGITDGPRDPTSISYQIQAMIPSCLKVTDMGPYKFVLTFQTKMEADLILEEYKPLLSDWFENVYSWNEVEACDTRRVWVEIRGLPPQAWSRDNIDLIASCWGRPICVDTPTDTNASFAVARVLMDTKELRRIEGEVLLDLESLAFRVFVCEAWVASPTKNSDCLAKKPNIAGWDSSEDESLEDDQHDSGDVVRNPVEADPFVMEVVSIVQESVLAGADSPVVNTPREVAQENQPPAAVENPHNNNDAGPQIIAGNDEPLGNSAAAIENLDTNRVTDSSDSEKTGSFDYTTATGYTPLVEIPVNAVRTTKKPKEKENEWLHSPNKTLAKPSPHLKMRHRLIQQSLKLLGKFGRVQRQHDYSQMRMNTE